MIPLFSPTMSVYYLYADRYLTSSQLDLYGTWADYLKANAQNPGTQYVAQLARSFHAYHLIGLPLMERPQGILLMIRIWLLKPSLP
jgi:hypothetical protein